MTRRKDIVKPYWLMSPTKIQNYEFNSTDGNLYLYGKGYQFGSWITDSGRSVGGFVSGDLVENPALMIEALARYSGLATSDIDTDAFDSAYTDTSAWKFAGVVNVEKSWLKSAELMAKHSGCRIWFDNYNRLTISKLNLDANFSVSETSTPGDRDKFLQNPAVTNDRYVNHMILPNTISVVKSTAEDVVNEVYINYNTNYASGTTQKTAFITDTDSDDGTGTRDQNSSAPNNRETLAGNSKTNYKTTGTLEVETPFIRDDATAVLLRNHLFDAFVDTRYIVVFNTTYSALTVAAGDVINIQHDLRSSIVSGMTTKRWSVTRVDKNNDSSTIEIEAWEL